MHPESARGLKNRVQQHTQLSCKSEREIGNLTPP